MLRAASLRQPLKREDGWGCCLAAATGQKRRLPCGSHCGRGDGGAVGAARSLPEEENDAKCKKSMSEMEGTAAGSMQGDHARTVGRGSQAKPLGRNWEGDELDRERALVETSPEAIICWDTGIGIPAEDHDRIFGRFERGHNAEARRSGAGLGLSLVQSFINLHRGDVELESEPGVGTKVVCCLPARRQDEEVPRLAGNG